MIGSCIGILTLGTALLFSLFRQSSNGSDSVHLEEGTHYYSGGATGPSHVTISEIESDTITVGPSSSNPNPNNLSFYQSKIIPSNCESSFRQFSIEEINSYFQSQSTFHQTLIDKMNNYYSNQLIPFLPNMSGRLSNGKYYCYPTIPTPATSIVFTYYGTFGNKLSTQLPTNSSITITSLFQNTRINLVNASYQYYVSFKNSYYVQEGNSIGSIYITRFLFDQDGCNELGLFLNQNKDSLFVIEFIGCRFDDLNYELNFKQCKRLVKMRFIQCLMSPYLRKQVIRDRPVNAVDFGFFGCQ